MNNITQRSDYTQALTTIKNIMDMTIQKNMQT